MHRSWAASDNGGLQSFARQFASFSSSSSNPATWSVAPSGIAPTYRVDDLKKILGSGFEMIRVSQCESPRVFEVCDKERTNWRSNGWSQ